jgi:hypothetical protein
MGGLNAEGSLGTGLGGDGWATRIGAASLHRCYDLVEQRKYSRMTPRVVNMDNGGAAVKWTQGLDRKIVSPTVVVGDLVSRRD